MQQNTNLSWQLSRGANPHYRLGISDNTCLSQNGDFFFSAIHPIVISFVLTVAITFFGAQRDKSGF